MLSVTVTVNDLNPSVLAVGEPVITPVAVLKLNPCGNAGLIEYTSGATPSLALTGLTFTDSNLLTLILLTRVSIASGGKVNRYRIATIPEPPAPPVFGAKK
jgi:hypothetical protein